jgi:mono/diheme cytochrome c family protein
MKCAILLAAVILLGAGCGSPRRAEPLVGPLELGDSARLGRLVYEKHCFRCHDQGAGGLAPSLNDKPLPGFLVRMQVRAGLGAMPAFSKQHISDEEMKALLDYIAAVRRAGS